MSTPQLPALTDRPVQRPWLTWILGALFLLGMAYWLVGPRTVRYARSLVSAHYAARAQEMILQKDWIPAGKYIMRARSWSPGHPQALRAHADMLIATRSDPLSLLQVLRLLESTPQAAPRDRLHISQILLSLGHMNLARAEYHKLSKTLQETQEAQEILASLYHAEGRHGEADKLMRRALAMNSGDDKARLRLAIMDHQNNFPEIQQQAEQKIWEIAQAQDDTGLRALEFLATQAQLDGQEAEKLLSLIEQHPHAQPATRYAALSARMRARPQDRTTILDAEIQALQGRNIEALAPAINWLLQEKQPRRVIELLKDDVYLKSGPLLQSYLVALSQLDRWPDIQILLEEENRLPASHNFQHLWKARTAEKLDADLRSVRHHLNAAFAQTLGGQDEPAARMTAEVAEQMHQWDLAARFYRDIASQHPLLQGRMLEKVYEMALRSRDTEAALTAAAELAAAQPENPVFHHRSLYLHLVAGDGIERTAQMIRQLPVDNSAGSHLLHALSAYRLGDLKQVKQHLASILDATSLSPGQRAVHAGLLSTSGSAGPAFQMAETIPSLLLLPEETRFLKRAL